MSWLRNPTSQAIKNMKYNYLGLFPFLFYQKLLRFLKSFFFSIFFVIWKQFLMLGGKILFQSSLKITSFIRVFFLNLMYSYEILNNLCDNNLQIIFNWHIRCIAILMIFTYIDISYFLGWIVLISFVFTNHWLKEILRFSNSSSHFLSIHADR